MPADNYLVHFYDSSKNWIGSALYPTITQAEIAQETAEQNNLTTFPCLTVSDFALQPTAIEAMKNKTVLEVAAEDYYDELWKRL